MKIHAIVTRTKFVQRGEISIAHAISWLLLFHLHASWVNVGPIKGGSTEYCHAGSQYSSPVITMICGSHDYAAMHMWRYFGPCSDELQSFADMSAVAIKRWSRGCQVERASWDRMANIWRSVRAHQAYFPCRSKFCDCE